MGISDHLTFEEMSEGQHMMTAYGSQIAGIAVNELTCGHLTIISPPEHPDDEIRDQHTLFLKVKTMDDDEVELLFNVGQVHQLGEAVLGIIKEHILQAFRKLDPPQHMQDDLDEQYSNLEGLYRTITGISSMSEMVMRAQEMQKDKGVSLGVAFGETLDTEAAIAMLNFIKRMMEDDEDDDDG